MTGRCPVNSPFTNRTRRTRMARARPLSIVDGSAVPMARRASASDADDAGRSGMSDLFGHAVLGSAGVGCHCGTPEAYRGRAGHRRADTVRGPAVGLARPGVDPHDQVAPRRRARPWDFSSPARSCAPPAKTCARRSCTRPVTGNERREPAAVPETGSGPATSCWSRSRSSRSPRRSEHRGAHGAASLPGAGSIVSNGQRLPLAIAAVPAVTRLSGAAPGGPAERDRRNRRRHRPLPLSPRVTAATRAGVALPAEPGAFTGHAVGLRRDPFQSLVDPELPFEL